jgi:hypothetical protein
MVVSLYVFLITVELVLQGEIERALIYLHTSIRN